jgi:FAD/FMN-containing dehydrogenase
VGTRCCAVLLTYTGTRDEAEPYLRPLLDLAPDGRMVEEMAYADLQCALDDPPGYRNYWSAEHLARLPDEAVDAFCAQADAMIVPSPTQHALFPAGGRVAREGHQYPIPWRDAPWVVHPFGLWEDPADDARGRAWAHGVRAAVRPWSTGAVYLNFIGDEGGERVIAGYGATNAARLAAVKAAYDPENVFHLNANIPPVPPRPRAPS